MILKLLTFFLTLSFLISHACAEPRIGRLDSGQAYRTDAQGNQIVDYIAELEVKNEALERRIRGLVAEVEDLRGPGGSQPRTSLKEKNLLSAGKSYQSQQGSFAPVPVVPNNEASTSPAMTKKRSLPAVSSSACGERECEIFISEVRARGERALRKQAALLKTAKKEFQSCDKELGQLRVAIKADRNVEKELRKVKLQTSAREDLLNQKEAEIAGKQKQVNSLQRKVGKLEETVRTLESEMVRLKQSEAKLRKASVKSKDSAATRNRSTTPSTSVQSATRASLSRSVISQSAEVSEEKRLQVKRLYSDVIKLRNKRDRLFKSYNSSKLSIKKRPVRSKSGKLPEQLLGLVKSTTNPRQLYVLEKEGRRLEKIAKSDIALIQRMQK